MAYATLHLKQPMSGQLRAAPVGFSWTSLFFGFLPAAFRGHWSMAIIMVLLALLTFGLSGIYFAFAYNRMYINHLLNEGYQAVGATMPIDLISQRLKRQIPQIAA